jgi:hypothetical protein
MQCPNCGQDIKIKREFCPSCGKRVNVAFDQIAASVHVDAATRRGQRLEHFLLWGLMALIVVGVTIHGVNYFWDRPLVYDGADLPAMDAPVVPLVPPPQLEVAAQDFFRLNLPPGQAPKVFASRQSPIKGELRIANGGTTQVEVAVENGLKFLIGRQERDGSWMPLYRSKRILPVRDETAAHQWTQTGLTALALMAFLGEGRTWQEKDAKVKVTQHGKCIEQAIRFLLKSQDAVNGRYGPAQGNFMYNHGLATLAMAEAAGLSGDQYLRESAQKGVNLIQNAQHPSGGWKYKDEISGNADTSVTSWQVQALLTASEIGLKVRPEVLSKSLDFLKNVTEPGGLVRYDLQDRAAFSPPGVALMLRRWLGETDSGALRLLTRKTLEGLPRSEKSWGRGWKEVAKGIDQDKRARTFDPYAWFYGTYGVFSQGGEDWMLWHSGPTDGQTPEVKVGLVPALLDLQESDGGWYASDKWTVKVGEVYSTALCILALQAYYRVH